MKNNREEEEKEGMSARGGVFFFIWYKESDALFSHPKNLQMGQPEYAKFNAQVS